MLGFNGLFKLVGRDFSHRRKHNIGYSFIYHLPAPIGLQFCHYNLVRQHKSLRIAPAMAAGVSDRMWLLVELVEQPSK